MTELLENITFSDQNLRIISQFLDGKSYNNLRLSHKHPSIILEFTNNNDFLKILVKKWLNYENDVSNRIGHISVWNVAYITNMSNLFYNAKSFNEDISGWNVSNVTNMGRMFYNAKLFNQDIRNWDVSNVNNMEYMFVCAESFNQDIGNWNFSNVTTMEHMFYHADSFHQDISNWDICNITNISTTFYGAVLMEEQNKPNFKIKN
jgi:surface protein